MPSIDEILADLDASEDNAEVAGEDADNSTDNSAIKAIRAAEKEAKKQARELGKALKEAQAEIATFRNAERESTVKGVFAELELPEKQAALFLKTHEGDVTADAIKQFVQDYGLKDLSAETGGTTEEKSEGFQPGGTGGAPADPKMYSLDEAKTLAATDGARLEQLIASGRVALDTLPGNKK